MSTHINIKKVLPYNVRRKLPLLMVCFITVVCCDENKTPTQSEPTGLTEQENLLTYVNPRIGTAHSRWFFFTPASMPFGMAKLAPSTDGSYGNPSGWEAVGYDPRHESIEGFSSLHEFQIGGLLFTGMTGNLKTIPGPLENPDLGYRSRFDKHDEIVEPGYYSVLLKDYDIRVELTATKRVGFQRYAFPDAENSYLIFDIGNQLGESGKIKDAHIQYNKENNTLEGYVVTYPEYVKKYQPNGDIRIYFYAEIDGLPMDYGSFNGKDVHRKSAIAKGKGAGMYLKFNTMESDTIVVKTGVSYTSINNAKNNLLSEAKDLTFDQALAINQKTWHEELGKIKVIDSSTVNKTKFYTALFHVLLGRGLSSDVSGDFPQNDGSIGQIPLDDHGQPKYQTYNTDAIWGAFWNLTQLWALVWPEYYNDFIQSQLEVYKNAGWLADGIANGKYVSGVGTNFMGLVISAGFQTDVLKDNINLAYEAALKNEIQFENRKEGAGKADLKSFVQDGFIPLTQNNNTGDGSQFSVSHSLEYAFSSYAVAQMAKELGRVDDYKVLMDLSDNWKKFYDTKTGFLRPLLADESFLQEFDPLQPWVGFQEGNAWQYSYYVPHDIETAIQLSGTSNFSRRLDSLFNVAQQTAFGGEGIDAFSGIKSIYNHGNQPSLHIPWLFNYTDKPWLTQKWTRKISEEFYGTDEIHGYGYGQDEDQGQLGAWYIMAALGLFDVEALTEQSPRYWFGSPLFDRVELSVGQDNTLILQTINNSTTNIYIERVKFNGKPHEDLFIPFKKLTHGGTLTFYMTDSPNDNLGKPEKPTSFKGKGNE